MEIFDNSFNSGVAEDVMTAATILATARPAERKAFMEGLSPEDNFAKQLKVVDETMTSMQAAPESAEPVAAE